MSYDLFDFTESLAVAGVQKERIEHCSLAFGENGAFSEWSGGFVCHTRSGAPWLFVFGWCDTTGWGCQDGAYVAEFDHEPTRDELRAAWFDAYDIKSTDRYDCGWADAIAHADEAPVDINRFLLEEIDQWGDEVSRSAE